jgi:HD superfamily phosphodiesterase
MPQEAEIGTLEWARRTGGRMSRSERWAMFAKAVGKQLQAMPYQLLQPWSTGRGKPPLELDRLVPPDSDLARRAEALCARVSSPALHQHCLRTYVWGRILAERDRLRFDDELFYVAAVLHDLGLSSHPRARDEDVHCFAVAGAYAARAFMDDLGWSAERTDALAEAICLHLNVGVSLEHGPEAYLLAASTAFDVVGARAWEVPKADLERVVARHPRHHLKDELRRLFADEARRRPESRTQFLCGWLPFDKLVREAPFAE